MSSTQQKLREIERKYKPQILSFAGFPYIRFLVNSLDEKEIKLLRNRYRYIWIYSYRKLPLPDFKYQTQTTGIIDLRQSSKEIFARFKKNTRNEIRKTAHIENLHIAAPDNDKAISYSFYVKVKRDDDKVNPEIRKEFDGCLFFNAYLGKTLISSMSCYDNGVTLRLKHIVTRRKEPGFDGQIISAASRQLIWEIIQYAKKRGYEKFDLAGMVLSNPSKAGIVAFKKSFGGKLETVHIYRLEKIPFPILRVLARTIFGKIIK